MISITQTENRKAFNGAVTIAATVETAKQNYWVYVCVLYRGCFYGQLAYLEEAPQDVEARLRTIQRY